MRETIEGKGREDSRLFPESWWRGQSKSSECAQSTSYGSKLCVPLLAVSNRANA